VNQKTSHGETLYPVVWFVLANLFTALTYYLSGRLGLMLAIPPGYITAIWPPSGLALAAILLRGNVLLPGIWLGSFAINLQISLDQSNETAIPTALWIAGWIAVGACLQAWVGSSLIKRFENWPNSLVNIYEIARFFLWGGVLACLVNATWGVAVLYLNHRIGLVEVPFAWSNWWVGDVIGVFLITPLVVIAGREQSLRSRRLLIFGAPVVVATCVSIATYVWISHVEISQNKSDFEQKATSLAFSIQQDFTGKVQEIASIANTLQEFPDVTEDQFRSIAASAIERRPGTLGFAWNEMVLGGERSRFEEEVRSDGRTDFRILQRNANDELVVAGARDKYMVIRFIEPLSEYANTLGLDPYAQADRRQAMDRACDSGQAIATGFTTLAQRPDRRDGYLVYHPVYEPGTWITESERRDHLRGFAVALLLASDVAKATLDHCDSNGLQLQISDPKSNLKNNPILSLIEVDGKSQSVQPSTQNDSNLVFENSLLVADQEWSLILKPTREYVASHRSWEPWAVLAVGLMLTSMTGGFLLYITGQKELIKIEVEQRTAALTAVNSRLKLVLDTSTQTLIVATDVKGVITLFNAGAERMLGYSASEVIGIMTPKAFHLDEEIEAHQRLVSNELGYEVYGFDIMVERVRRGLSEEREWTYVNKDGRKLIINLALTAKRDQQGEIIGFLAVGIDVTIRKKIKKELRDTVERLNLILENARHATWDWDVASGQIDLGEHWRTILGIEVKVIDFHHLFGIVHPDDAAHIQAALELAMGSNDAIIDAEFRAKHCDGRYIWVNVRGRVQSRDADGKALRNMGTIHDVSERKQAEEKFTVLFEHSTHAHLLFNETDGILDCNPAALKMLRCYSKEALLKLHPASLSPEFQPDGRRSMEKCIEMDSAARVNGCHRFEWSHVRFDGEVFPCEVTLTPVPFAGSTALLVAWQDLSARKLAETQIAKHTEDLARSNMELEQFAYIASHDLREPLRMVQSFCGLLRDRYAAELDDRARKYIHFAVDGAARMQNLVDDLLEFSRVGRNNERFESLDLATIVDQAMTNLAISINETNALVDVSDMPTVQGSSSRLIQVFQNLIGNAIKFRGNKEPSIRIIANRDGDFWRLTVSDDGIGIDPKHFEKLFVVFQRLHTKEEYAGTGIGLALSKRIIELHGGRIWVESEPGKGTSFHFLLSPAVAMPSLHRKELAKC
jgi:PAS domain S-box-containing protein